MSKSDTSTNTSTQSPTNAGETMSTETPKTPKTTDAPNTPPTEDNAMSTETTPHHQYYAYGTTSEEWIPGSYREPFIWPTPDVLPYSENYYSIWEGLPSRRTISEGGLERFKQCATPISKEEYDHLTSIKCARQEADSHAEYMWSGPRYDDED